MAVELGVCPAGTERRLDGLHGGTNAGRACWAVAGTYTYQSPHNFCGEKVKGTHALKIGDCLKCDFYKRLKGKMRLLSPGRIRLKLMLHN